MHVYFRIGECVRSLQCLLLLHFLTLNCVCFCDVSRALIKCHGRRDVR